MVIEPLDLKFILVNIFAGSMEYFFFIAIIFFAYLAAKYRMTNVLFLMMMGLFIILMAGYGFQILYVAAIFLIGLIAYFILAKLVK